MKEARHKIVHNIGFHFSEDQKQVKVINVLEIRVVVALSGSKEGIADCMGTQSTFWGAGNVLCIFIW